MPLVYACIAPHGSELIPQLARNRKAADRFEPTRLAMEHLANEVRKMKPDTVVIASPHNLRIWKKIGIVFTENSTGFLQSDSPRGSGVQLSTRCDVRFARELYGQTIDRGLPVVGVNYGTFEGRSSDLQMDWGTLIPLWFLVGGRKNNAQQIVKPLIVIVTPSREIPLRQNVAFGREIANLASKSDRRIVFVASADQAHTHSRNGPYGFHTAAARFDTLAVEAVKSGNISRLLKVSQYVIEDAKPDSIWQFAMLSGIMSKEKMTPQFLSYDVPTYFGMICAGFYPQK
jgi:aromatic ring-opening dioxygenase LigB subunit